MTSFRLNARRPIDPPADDGFEVSYVPDDGAVHRMPLARAWEMPLERSLPVRRFTSRKGQRHLSGTVVVSHHRRPRGVRVLVGNTIMCCIWISTRPSASRRSRCGCTGPTKGGLASAEPRWPTKYIEYWPGWRCLTQPVGTSSVHTLKLVNAAGPKVLLRATSAASRPRAINTLPMRGVL